MADNLKCPKCNNDMDIRVNRSTGVGFLSCRAYPACNGTRQLGCPSCGQTMFKRTNNATHEQFMGCSKYPECRGTRPFQKQKHAKMTVSEELQNLIDLEDDGSDSV